MINRLMIIISWGHRSIFIYHENAPRWLCQQSSQGDVAALHRDNRLPMKPPYYKVRIFPCAEHISRQAIRAFIFVRYLITLKGIMMFLRCCTHMWNISWWLKWGDYNKHFMPRPYLHFTILYRKRHAEQALRNNRPMPPEATLYFDGACIFAKRRVRRLDASGRDNIGSNAYRPWWWW